jgi:hypothetical protein
VFFQKSRSLKKAREREAREDRRKGGWQGRDGGWDGNSNTVLLELFNMVSCCSLYFRCPFGYSGVDCKDRKCRSLLL